MQNIRWVKENTWSTQFMDMADSDDPQHPGELAGHRRPLPDLSIGIGVGKTFRHPGLPPILTALEFQWMAAHPDGFGRRF